MASNKITAEMLKGLSQDAILALINGANKAGQVTVKMSRYETGVVCIYGFGKNVISLYPDQIDRLAAAMPEIMAYTKANRKVLEAQSAAFQAMTETQKAAWREARTPKGRN